MIFDPASTENQFHQFFCDYVNTKDQARNQVGGQPGNFSHRNFQKQASLLGTPTHCIILPPTPKISADCGPAKDHVPE